MAGRAGDITLLLLLNVLSVHLDLDNHPIEDAESHFLK